ncbi:MAG: hypothetical protein OEU26_03820 [Candidatus Tectomicrobia bacterium]|nr:hypothetical protein [Candidatus Tectomicrobia bacterium]
MAAKQAIIHDAAFEALATYASSQRSSPLQHFHDAGPAVLAALAAASGHEVGHEVSVRALGAWLDGFPGGTVSAGVFGGLSGFLVGVQVASSFYPRLIPLARQLRNALANAATDRHWRTEAVAWEDYDLVSGPAGMILALATDHSCSPQFILPTARHLALLCDSDDLERLRVGAYRDDELRAWNYGRINSGLAHGVTGVAAALRSASEIAVEVREELSPPLQRVCRWLIADSYVDDRELWTWHPAGLEGGVGPRSAIRRQAWCYGTPSVAWTLWEAARVLGDVTLQAFAEDAMRSFCTAFDETFYIDKGPVSDALGVCHGAAGMLAIADAFALHPGLTEAASLRDRLEGYLLDRIDEIQWLAHRDMTLITGASGILAVLLTRHGAQREWLSQIALR